MTDQETSWDFSGTEKGDFRINQVPVKFKWLPEVSKMLPHMDGTNEKK